MILHDLVPDLGRRRHYGDFYDPVPDVGDDRPVLAVVGNCQAESLRLMLDGDDLRTVRLPPVHEWTADDLEPLYALLPRLDLLVSQPVADGYRGLPIGTGQLLAGARPDLRHLLVPGVRFAGLHPFHVVVHPPHLPSPDPPLAPYHDLRTALRASRPGIALGVLRSPALTAAAVRAVAADSVEELRRREEANGTLVVHDLVAPSAAPDLRTVNHPGNRILSAMAARIRAALGLPEATPRVTRPLLDAIHAPVEEAVTQVYDATPSRPTWRIGEREVSVQEVEDAHLGWYASRPDVLGEVLRRSTRQLAQLGLEPG